METDCFQSRHIVRGALLVTHVINHWSARPRFYFHGNLWFGWNIADCGGKQYSLQFLPFSFHMELTQPDIYNLYYIHVLVHSLYKYTLRLTCASHCLHVL